MSSLNLLTTKGDRSNYVLKTMLVEYLMVELTFHKLPSADNDIEELLIFNYFNIYCYVLTDNDCAIFNSETDV